MARARQDAPEPQWIFAERRPRAFPVQESTVAQRIVRSKRTLAEKRVPFEVPGGGGCELIAEFFGLCSETLNTIFLISLLVCLRTLV